MHPTQDADLRAAITGLLKSERGILSMKHILTWMDDVGVGLDGWNQEDAMMIIQLCWSNPGSARDVIRDALR